MIFQDFRYMCQLGLSKQPLLNSENKTYKYFNGPNWCDNYIAGGNEVIEGLLGVVVVEEEEEEKEGEVAIWIFPLFCLAPIVNDK